MTTHARPRTAERDRVPFSQRLIYGIGAFVNNLLAGSIGAMLIVLNLGLGMEPWLAGLIAGLPRFFDALTDPVMGYVSDNTRTRWGRRRPYIFIGAVLVAIVFALMWQAPSGMSQGFYFWWFLIASLLFYTAYTVFATPWVALGYEMTPDYDERSRLMGTQNFIGQLAYFVPPWLFLAMSYEPFFGDDLAAGASVVALVIALFVGVAGVMPAIFLRERLKSIAQTEAEQAHGVAAAGVTDFLKSFAKVVSFAPFLKLCAATFLIFNGFIMIAAFQSYVIIYYLFAGDNDAAGVYIGYAGTISTFSTFAVVALVTWISTRLGKRRAFMFSTAVSMAGYALKWVCYDPAHPWLILLPMPLIAFGLGGLFTVMPALMADVVDLDELNTHQRREGMFGSIYWWVVKLGMSVALMAGGVLLSATGFDEALGGGQSERTLFLLRVFDVSIPFVFSALAIWIIRSFSVSRERALDVRRQLEARRGAPDPAAA